MEFGIAEYALILIAVISVLAVAFGLAWIDASPRKNIAPRK